MKKVIVMSVLMMVFCVGCAAFQELTGADVGDVDKMSDTAAATGELLAGLATVFGVPILSLIGGGLIAGAKVWRNMKPKIEEAETEADMYHDVAEVLINNIEDIKNNQPELWAKIKPFIASKQVGNVTAVVRALRGK